MSGDPNGGGGGARKPTPVRELSSSAAPPVEPTDIEETSVEVDGEAWTVRVLGRSRSATGGTPLLLLGFRPSAAEEPGLEVLVPARLLSELGASRLRAALERARPPLDAERPLPFFTEGRRSGRR